MVEFLFSLCRNCHRREKTTSLFFSPFFFSSRAAPTTSQMAPLLPCRRPRQSRGGGRQRKRVKKEKEKSLSLAPLPANHRSSPAAFLSLCPPPRFSIALNVSRRGLDIAAKGTSWYRSQAARRRKAAQEARKSPRSLSLSLSLSSTHRCIDEKQEISPLLMRPVSPHFPPVLHPKLRVKNTYVYRFM